MIPSQLPDVSTYSNEEIQRASSLSSAVSRYLNLREIPTTEVAHQLRQQRHHYWLNSALAVLLKTASAEQVCYEWSLAADLVVKKAWDLSGCQNHDLALFALGKWGSMELNLSSDIDILLVSASTPDSEMFSAAKRMISLLSESTEFGFCFRVDTDLKPGGRQAPIISSLHQLEDYYWSLGATWERLALVRLRPICGSTTTIQNGKKIIDQFVYRKHLDFDLLNDLKSLRSQIHGHYKNPSDGYNLKLSPGGIRDIELFIHALQVIHGGKYPHLRTSSTSRAASVLISENRFSSVDLTTLIQNYWILRDHENYLQALDDAQTHMWSLPIHGPLPKGVNEQLQLTQKIVNELLGKPEEQSELARTEEYLKPWLLALGFSEQSIQQYANDLLAITHQSVKNSRDDKNHRRVLKVFLEKMSQLALDRDLGLGILIDFCKAIRVKASFFSLMLHEPKIIEDLCVLFGSSPYLGGILAARPELLDSFIFRAQAPLSADLEAALEQLTEKKLLNEIVSAIHFLKAQDLSALNQHLSSTADQISNDLLALLNPPSSAHDVGLLALGKWGGQELGFRSDLDFIFCSSEIVGPEHHKIAKRFISRMTEQHRGGNIYPIDIRLRPSGKAGPIIVNQQQFLEYVANQAEIWERQSYLKARWLGAHTKDFSTKIHQACFVRSISEEEISILKKIKQDLRKTSPDEIEYKYGPGGLIELEFSTQLAVLQKKLIGAGTSTADMILHLSSTDSHWQSASTKLIKNYNFLRQFEQCQQLTALSHKSNILRNDPSFQRIAHVLKSTSDALRDQLLFVLAENEALLKNLDPREA